uniref:Solute carrier family 25 member 3 n=1 Tax=Vombatus ursinus TaxID=29139 RepID=A0A4X2KAA6_VOMUR
MPISASICDSSVVKLLLCFVPRRDTSEAIYSNSPILQMKKLRLRYKSCVSAVLEYSCEYGSMKFYVLCGIGGNLICGLTHIAVIPLDLVKCRMHVDPQKYKGIFNGFSITLREDGVHGLAKGWAPTFIGYSMRGLCKFGFYEVFEASKCNCCNNPTILEKRVSCK